MLLIPGSCLFAFNTTMTFRYGILFFFSFLIVYKAKYRDKYSILLVALIFVFTVFTRFLNRGAGLDSWLQFALCVLSTSVAVHCNQRMFLTRFVRAVSVFAVIALCFWGLFTMMPQLVDIWPAKEYLTQVLGSKDWEQFYHGKGMLFYSYLTMHPTRNCGFYTEPGVYQIVLNSVLFILLFWKDKIFISSEFKYRKTLLVIIMAIITCQSTTGYLAFIVILFFFYLSKQREYSTSRIKNYILLVFGIALIVLFVDYSTRGEQSILYLQILNKLFGGTGNGLDVSASTGQYRLGSIIVGVNSMIQHPLGVGYELFAQAKNSYGIGMVAASIISFGAVYGVVPWFVTIIYIFAPVFKYQRTLCAWLLLILFVNTTLAQTELLYPAQILFPIILANFSNVRDKGNLNKKLET